MERKVIYGGFLLPVIDGEIWLGQRAKEFVEGQGDFGAVGGKAELKGEAQSKPEYITKMGGAQVVSIADTIAQAGGREYPLDTALREFWEELFGEAGPQPHEFTDAIRLGMVVDMIEATPSTQYCNYMHLANVKRRDFHLNPRELVSVARLVDVKPSRIFPIARIMLEEIRFQSISRLGGKFAPYLDMQLHKQIPRFRNLPYRFTSMPGPHANPSFGMNLYNEPYYTLLMNFEKGSF